MNILNLSEIKKLTSKKVDSCIRLAEEDRKFIANAIAFKYFPLVVARSEGVYVWDLDGNKYIDFLSSAAVFNIGHTNERVVKAVVEQSSKFLNYTIAYFYTVPSVELAKLLISVTPGTYPKKVTYGFSGSDAVDSATKIARVYTKRPHIISYYESYHGMTYGALSATGIVDEKVKELISPHPHNHLIHYPNPYRNVWGVDGYERKDDLVSLALKEFEETLNKLSPDKVAGIVVEPIQGDAGVIVPPKEYFMEVRKICDKHGILFIDEEIQTGLGRTGKFWAIEHFEIEPDLLVTAKALGGGLPISAVVGKAEIMDSLPSPFLLFTHAGHALSAVAAIETVKTVLDERLYERAAKLGEYALKRLKEMQERYEVIGDVRGKGLLIGVELVKNRKTKEPYRELALKTCWRAWEKGLILITFGTYGNVLRIAPPLTITLNELDVGLNIIEESLKDALNGKIPNEILKFLSGW